MKVSRSLDAATLGDGHMRVMLAECARFRPSMMQQFRRKLREGGTPIFVLTEGAVRIRPEWYPLVQDTQNEVRHVTTPSHPIAGKLTTVQQIYQVARDTCRTRVTVPVDQMISTAHDVHRSKTVATAPFAEPSFHASNH